MQQVTSGTASPRRGVRLALVSLSIALPPLFSTNHFLGRFRMSSILLQVTLLTADPVGDKLPATLLLPRYQHLDVLELPDVVVERGQLHVAEHPGHAVLGHGAPALVVDATVAEPSVALLPPFPLSGYLTQ